MRDNPLHKRKYLYLYLAVGYLFISINLYINGLGIIFPTCVGYLIIARTSYLLHFNNKVFLYTVIPSAIMVILTIPFLLIEFIQSDASKYIYWPANVLAYFILITHCFGIYKCSVVNDFKKIKTLSIISFLLIPTSTIIWYLSPLLGISKTMSFFIYETPKLFFAVVSYLCYKKFA